MAEIESERHGPITIRYYHDPDCASPREDDNVGTIPKRILRKLKEARRYASLESASFGFDHDRVSLNGGPPVNKTDFIKRGVLIHHHG